MQFLKVSSVISLFVLLLQVNVFAQSVSVGAGSYSTTLPPGQIGPQKANGEDVHPKVSSDFSLPVQTNDFWSSLIFPFFDDPYSSALYAHPIHAKAVSQGLEIGSTSDHILVNSDFIHPYNPQMTVGISGMDVPSTLTDDYGDWTVTALWKNETSQMKATIGHGLPFAFFEITGGNAFINFTSAPYVWYNQNGSLGLTVDGRHYGIFAPSGSEWTVGQQIESSLNGGDYLSVALLPDTDTQTFELFRSHGYAFVTNSEVNWDYNEQTATLTSNFTYETTLRESGNGNVNETLSALYRHQWLYTEDELTEHTYNTSTGIMKLNEGNEFSTVLRFNGMLPSLPDLGEYDRDELLTLVEDVSDETIGVGPTYENGKAIGRFSELVYIADQLGATEERDYFLNQLKLRLEDWFTAGGPQEYSYNDEWDVLTGYPSGYGADREINDHHFHASYAIRGAATIAQFDSVWAKQENWGGMVNMLIKDASNWNRNDTMFPFLRSFDAYAGHSWAAGHGAFGNGNNQESSSESMNYASSVLLWGEVTGQKEIRDLGIFLYTNETRAIEQYWFDVDEEVFPDNYPYGAIGIHWGNKGAHTTWFGNNPEFIHGINLLPINGGSFYLGRNPEYVEKNYNEVVAERGGQPVVWKDVFWQYLSFSDSDLALSLYNADQQYAPFDGESRAHTMHWLYNLQKLGQVETEIFGSVPTYAVFRNSKDEHTYIAYNSSHSDKTVEFTDGFSMEVPARQMVAQNSSTGVSINPSADLKPSTFSLEQNYPNPFNPATQIRYKLPNSSQVTLSVYNMLGKEVAKLVDSRQPAGQHTVSFDARSLSSGFYIYQIQAGEFVSTKKMLLIK